MWFTSARRHRAKLAAARAESARLRDERDEALKQRTTAEFNREQILRQLAGAEAANVDLHGQILELGRRISQLTESDPEYAAQLERQVAEVSEEHDVHRKTLADALGEDKRHLGWDALIGEVGGLASTVADLRADCEVLKERADRHQRLLAEGDREASSEWRGRARRAEKRVAHLEKELDNATGLPAGGILSSGTWQPGYEAPESAPKAAS